MTDVPIYSALVTPYRDDDAVDEATLAALLDFQAWMGVSGVYVGGSSGEAPLQSLAERIAVLEAVAAHDAPLGKIAHVGAVSTRETRKLADEANRLGYDAISAISPFYYGFSEPEIIAHYRAVAESSDLPLIVYTFPQKGLGLSFEACCALLEMPEIGGLKYTSADLYMMSRLKRRYPDKTIYNGFDEIMLAGLAMGADGAIGTTYNFMGDVFVAIAAAERQGRMDVGRKLQGMANDLIVRLYPSIINGTKYMLTQMGVESGAARAPFLQLDWGDDPELTTAFRRLLDWRDQGRPDPE